MRTAIYLDYDNFCSGLRLLSPTAAQRFTDAPGRWLAWLADVLGVGGDERPSNFPDRNAHPERPAGLLALHSYLNPRHFGAAEAGLRQAGFQVWLCPPVTAQGKTLADPRLMLQCLDDMHAHGPALQQVLVMSADGDFTPLLERARQWQRRTVVLSAGHVTRAYAEAADLMVDLSDFLQDGLGHPLYRGRRTPGEAMSEEERQALMEAARAEVLRRLCAAPSQRVNAGTLSHHLRSLLPDLVATHWAGCGQAAAFVRALAIPGLEQDDKGRWMLLPNGKPAAAPSERTAAPPQKSLAATSVKPPEPTRTSEPSPAELLRAAGLPADCTASMLQHLARKLWVHLGSGVPFDIGYTARHIHTALRLEGHVEFNPEHVHAFLQALVFGGFDMNRPLDNAQAVLQALKTWQTKAWTLGQPAAGL
jgi:hypothetical protein